MISFIKGNKALRRLISSVKSFIFHFQTGNHCFHLKRLIPNQFGFGVFFMPIILFSYTTLLPQNINVTNFTIILIIVLVYVFNFAIIYPKIKLESGYINVTPTMISNHIKEFEKIQGNRKTEKNT